MTVPVISILIPVYNEAEILEVSMRKLLEWLQSQHIEAEILLLDNGSQDETRVLAEQLAKLHAQVRYFYLDVRGPGRAFALGAREARSDIILTLDADLSSDLGFIAKALKLMEASDVVVGSKSMGRQRRTLLRIFGSQLYIFFAQRIFGLHVSDYSIGCKCFRRQKILPVLESLDPWTGLMLELFVYCRQQNLSLVQIGVDCEDYRTSHFSLLHEGWYRYLHLFRLWCLARDASSWVSKTSK